MSGVILHIADRQDRAVQQRAFDAVAQQRETSRRHLSLAEICGSGPMTDPGLVLYRSVADWYDAQPIAKGRIRPRLHLCADERRAYGLPSSARLVDLRGLGQDADHRHVVVVPVCGGYAVGVKSPDAGGLGVLWRKSCDASSYAMRLSVEHDLPIRERYA